MNDRKLTAKFDIEVTDDGKPFVNIEVAEADERGYITEEVGHMPLASGQASLFAINLLHAAMHVESRAASMMAMRMYKIDEATINEVVEETDKIRRSRRSE